MNPPAALTLNIVDAPRDELFFLAELASVYPQWRIWHVEQWYAARRQCIDDTPPPGAVPFIAAATPSSLCAQLRTQAVSWGDSGGIDVPALLSPLGVHGSGGGDHERAGT